MDEIFLALIAFGLVATPAVAACGLWWLIWGPATFRLLPIQRQRKSWWTGGEVVVVFAIFLFTRIVVFSFMDSIGFFDRLYSDADKPDRGGLWVHVLATPLVVALVLAYMYGLSRTKPSHLGLTNARFGQNALLGCLAFLVATPILFAILFVVSGFIPLEPHAMQKLGNKSLWPVEWGLIVFATTAAAPLLEEVVFRGVLLFWMIRASRNGHWTVVAIVLALSALPTVQEWNDHQYLFLGPLLWIVFLAFFYVAAVKHCDSVKEIPFDHWPPNLKSEFDSRQRDGDYDDESTDGNDMPVSRPPAILQHANPCAAILGSAIFFAAIHGAWPSPVPLFFMGLVLAWLAYRTQSLVAPIVFHSLFNGVSVVIMALSAMLR